jgi:Vanillate O-demethylase oxygenase C-terminal domain
VIGAFAARAAPVIVGQEVAPTFVEDRVMVEAQQARLNEFGEDRLVDIASDATRMQMRRIMERLIAEDQSALAAE